jgi:hypothetical protein
MQSVHNLSTTLAVRREQSPALYAPCTLATPVQVNVSGETSSISEKSEGVQSIQ